MSSEPSARYQDGGALAAALDEFAGPAARDARARLAKRMQWLFAAERATESACLAEFQATATAETEGKPVRAGAIATDMALELQTHVSTVQKPPIKAIVLGVTAVIALVALVLFRASERPVGAAAPATVVETATANPVVAPATAAVPVPPEPARADQPSAGAAETAPMATTPVEATSARTGKPAARTAPVRTAPAPPAADRAKSNGERGVIRSNPFGALE